VAYRLGTWARVGSNGSSGSVPLQLKNGLNALRVLRVIRLLRVVRFIHTRFLQASALGFVYLCCPSWINHFLHANEMCRFGFRTLMVYLETLQQSFYPLAAFSVNFLMFIFICAIMGQQLFAGSLSTCSDNLIILRENCNLKV
jgi:hypothetical protein